jgi:hypothetical protein
MRAKRCNVTSSLAMIALLLGPGSADAQVRAAPLHRTPTEDLAARSLEIEIEPDRAVG